MATSAQSVSYRSLGYDTVFVAIDGTEQQEMVLQRAIIVAANNNADLYIGYVIDSTTLEAAGAYPKDIFKKVEENFLKMIAPQVQEAKAEPLIKSVHVVVKAGRIRETLKDEMIDVIKPDLIICGARGLSSIKYALLGSISTFLLRSADCDVLVMK